MRHLNSIQSGLPKYVSLILIPLLSLFFSCNPAKYVPQGSYLLSKNKVEITKKAIPVEQLESYLLQKPNKRILGVRFHLGLYNISKVRKNNGWNNYFRKIGEEPVIYNPSQTESSTEQLKQFMENKGYYHSVVTDTVIFHKRNAIAEYKIVPGEPYRVRKISYYFEDTTLMKHVLPDTIHSLLKRNMKFDKDVLQNERLRIEALLKENGYFNFSKEYIYYEATIDAPAYKADLVTGFKEYVPGVADPYTKVKYHPRFRIGQVTVYPNYDTETDRQLISDNALVYDTTKYQDLLFLTRGKKTLKPSTVANVNYIIPGEFYKQDNVNKTYRNLSELGPVRYTNINFKESDSLTGNELEKLLDCRIELTRKKVQSYQAELAGTNSGGDLGIRGNVTYQNQNLFRGAEVFNTRLTGAIEALKNRSKNQYSSMKEIGAETGITFPKFFAPLRLEGFVRKYAPKTSISGSYNYQSRPDYTRSIANASFSYRWNGRHPSITHTLWPIEVNYINIYDSLSSKEFLDSIRLTPLGYSFEDHIVNVIRYGFELNNQSIRHNRDFFFLHFNIETAGNIVNYVNKKTDKTNTEGTYQLLNVPYFQYVRSDVDIRYYNVINSQNKFAYRIYAGLGVPYGNSSSLPFEKKFFSGGPNSIRAWSSRDLGPGSDTTSSKEFDYPNKNGDIKLEGNVEYRFKVIWKLEGALFLDAGNIWSMNPDPAKPGADFQWNRFYKEIAVGTGIGTRWDFSFFILRLDFGLKLHDPALPENNRWVPVFRNFNFNHFHLNFGIGYPF